jgi:crossover junction endodeoxyribonuclease RusA
LIKLKLPYPPSVNNYWMASGHRRYISKRGMEFKNEVRIYCLQHKIPKLGSFDVAVGIVIHPRSKILMDIDNCSKAVLDSLEGAGIIDDDKQVVKLIIMRGGLVKGGGCTVYIEKVSPSMSLDVNLPTVDS